MIVKNDYIFDIGNYYLDKNREHSQWSSNVLNIWNNFLKTSNLI